MGTWYENGWRESSTQITRSAVATSNSNRAMTPEFEGGSLLLSTVESGWRPAMIPCRYAVSSLVAITVFLAVGFTCGADPPTLEELAAAIDRVRTGPDGERVVAGHISRKLAVSVEVLRAQRARTGLDWGDLLIANLLCKTKEPTVDHVAAEFKGGAGWADIARHHNVNLDQLRNEVQQSQQAMEQRSEDRAPPRSSESQSSPGTTAPTTVVPKSSPGTTAPTTVLPTGKGSSPRY
jgi:hypothetical protein